MRIRGCWPLWPAPYSLKTGRQPAPVDATWCMLLLLVIHAAQAAPSAVCLYPDANDRSTCRDPPYLQLAANNVLTPAVAASIAASFMAGLGYSTGDLQAADLGQMVYDVVRVELQQALCETPADLRLYADYVYAMPVLYEAIEAYILQAAVDDQVTVGPIQLASFKPSTSMLYRSGTLPEDSPLDMWVADPSTGPCKTLSCSRQAAYIGGNVTEPALTGPDDNASGYPKEPVPVSTKSRTNQGANTFANPQLLMYYRYDALPPETFTPPATWEELVQWAAAANGTIDLDGDGVGEYALCIDALPACKSVWVLLGILAPMVQGRTSDGLWFDPRDMAPVAGSAAFPYAVQLFRQLVKYSVPLTGSPGDGCVPYDRPMFQGRCLMTFNMDQFRSSLQWRAKLPVGALGVAAAPGSRQLLNWDANELQPCDATRCPFALRLDSCASDGAPCYVNRAPLLPSLDYDELLARASTNHELGKLARLGLLLEARTAAWAELLATTYPGSNATVRVLDPTFDLPALLGRILSLKAKAALVPPPPAAGVVNATGAPGDGSTGEGAQAGDSGGGGSSSSALPPAPPPAAPARRLLVAQQVQQQRQEEGRRELLDVGQPPPPAAAASDAGGPPAAPTLYYNIDNLVQLGFDPAEAQRFTEVYWGSLVGDPTAPPSGRSSRGLGQLGAAGNAVADIRLRGEGVAYRTALAKALWQVLYRSVSLEAASVEADLNFRATLNLTANNITRLQYKYWKDIGYSPPPQPPPPPAPSVSPPPDDGGLHGGALAAAIAVPVTIGVLLAVICALVVALIYARRRAAYGGFMMRHSRPPGATADTTLLLTDIQNSTVLWETLPSDVMDAALKCHHGVLRGLLKPHYGYESATEGDAFILAFHRAEDAANYAVQAQLALCNAQWPPETLVHPDCELVWVRPEPSDPVAQLSHVSKELMEVITQAVQLGIAPSSQNLPLPPPLHTEAGLQGAGQQQQQQEQPQGAQGQGQADEHGNSSGGGAQVSAGGGAEGGGEVQGLGGGGAGTPAISEEPYDAHGGALRTVPRQPRHLASRRRRANSSSAGYRLSLRVPDGVEAEIWRVMSNTVMAKLQKSPSDIRSYMSDETAAVHALPPELPPVRMHHSKSAHALAYPYQARPASGPAAAGTGAGAGAGNGALPSPSAASGASPEAPGSAPAAAPAAETLTRQALTRASMTDPSSVHTHAGTSASSGGGPVMAVTLTQALRRGWQRCAGPDSDGGGGGDGGDESALLAFRGMRIRMGIHTGVSDASEVCMNKATGRMQYSGAFMTLAKAVGDAAHGGQVLLSPSAFRALPPGALAKLAFLLHMGEHTLFETEPAEPLYQLLPYSLACRLAFFQPLRTVAYLRFGLPDAPVGNVTVAFMYVVGAAALTEWNAGLAGPALELFHAAASEHLNASNGYLVELVDGLCLAAFRSAGDALLWSLHVGAALLDADWPAGLLDHELCEEVCVPLQDPVTGLLTYRPVMRGLRLKVGMDMGFLSDGINASTGRMAYRGRAMNRAARIASKTAAGQVHCSRAVWESAAPRLALAARDRSAAAASCSDEVQAVSLGLHSFKGVVEKIEVMSVSFKRNALAAEAAPLAASKRVQHGGGGAAAAKESANNATMPAAPTGGPQPGSGPAVQPASHRTRLAPTLSAGSGSATASVLGPLGTSVSATASATAATTARPSLSGTDAYASGMLEDCYAQTGGTAAAGDSCLSEEASASLPGAGLQQPGPKAAGQEAQPSPGHDPEGDDGAGGGATAACNGGGGGGAAAAAAAVASGHVVLQLDGADG